jgi:hypothetical protein
VGLRGLVELLDRDGSERVVALAPAAALRRLGAAAAAALEEATAAVRVVRVCAAEQRASGGRAEGVGRASGRGARVVRLELAAAGCSSLDATHRSC